jgi:uncharacterized protein YndB with AHSA1/START domain
MTPQMTELRLERTFDAPRERVFDAWTNPEVLRRWWAAAPEWDCSRAEVDLRPGGSYRLSMNDPGSGETHTVGGAYSAVQRPERLVYTWAWEGQDTESVVTVDFTERDGRTTVVVTHSALAGDEDRGNHEHGWNGCLDNLERRVLAG